MRRRWLAALAVPLLTACGGGGPTVTGTGTFPLVIGVHGLEGGGHDLRVSQGQDVLLALTSHLAGELTLLVRGYDVRGELDAGDGVAQVSFRAVRRGDFALSVEETGMQVAVLHVR